MREKLKEKVREEEKRKRKRVEVGGKYGLELVYLRPLNMSWGFLSPMFTMYVPTIGYKAYGFSQTMIICLKMI